MSRSFLLRYGSRGDRVRGLQALLNHNRFYRPARKLTVDGQMGPLTCAAVQRAKYRLGYRSDECLPIVGARFMELLGGRTPLPAAMRARRLARLADFTAAAKRRAMRLRALTIIKGELGTTEAGGHSNRIKYTEWWGWGPCAYCVIGISWAWIKAGSKAFVRGSRWANTDAMLGDAKAHRNGLGLTNDPKPGCPGVIDFDGHADPDHAITFVKDNGDGTCQTYEFNTTGPNGLEGVFEKRRPLANTWWFEVEH